MTAVATGEVTELLQQLIRNACVNDGTKGSGGESRSADLLAAYLDGFGGELRRFEPAPGRASVLATIEGTDPTAPSLLLMGHTDVVPVNADRWREDPFAGELIDGEVWGRGAVDMLNLTASMAVAFRRAAADGFRPRGRLSYLAVADEEALGTFGAEWLTENAPDAVLADFVVTESGGFRMPLPSESGPKLPILVGEKGAFWRRIRVKGTPGHGSMPYRTDNALVTAAEVVRRLDAYRPQTKILDLWRRFVESSDLPDEMTALLLDPDRVEELTASFPDIGLARMVHACTHTTFAPTVMRGGVKTNVIPDTVDLDLDIRTLPGESADDVTAMLQEALGDLFDRVDVLATTDDLASESPMDTPLWDSLSRVTEGLIPGSRTVPFILVGATDARFFRRKGVTAYGYGLFSERISFAQFASMFHGDDERVDVESLRLTTELWEGLIRDLMG
jgi:acetylornithine deacetylase/succinyl-diaminopimelate desuccinylase-like protein